MRKNQIIQLLFILLLFILPWRLTAQEVAATVHADTNAMLIGDQVNLDLRLELPEGYQFSWPRVADTLAEDLQVLSRSKVDTSFSKDKKMMTITQRIRFTSFDSGVYTIPPMTFLYRHLPDTAVSTVTSEPVMMAVHTVRVDTTLAIKPIKGPMSIPLSFREMLPWILAGLAVLLIAGGIIYYLWRRKQRKPVFQLRPKVRLKPWETALIELEKLRVKKLWQAGRVKDYYSELTEILRRYIEERYMIMALEKTSAEILYDIRAKSAMQEDTIQLLEEILTIADMVKFAKMQPLPEENERSMQHATGFINLTTPSETEDKPQSQGS